MRAQGVSLEFRVKAAYLYNFVKFVEWPPEAPSGPITICVAGRNPFGPVLADTLRGAQVNGRALASRVITGPDPGCHVLYVPEGTSPEPYLRAARTAPILTVGETPDFLRDGGDIRFTRENGRVRFEINALAAERTDLRISSRLLQVAQMVEGTP